MGGSLRLRPRVRDGPGEQPHYLCGHHRWCLQEHRRRPELEALGLRRWVNATRTNTQTQILYAATERAGVFRRTDRGRSWHSFNQGLTTRNVSSLAIDATGHHLFAGTGRSASGGAGGVFDYAYPA